jgi:periplasmic protein TonB
MNTTLNTIPVPISNALTLTGVVLLHVLGLVWAAQQLSITEPAITPPSVVGILVAPEPEPAPPPPKPVPPPPKPEPEPKPVAKPVPKPTPKPTPKPEPVREVAPEPVQEAAPAPPAPPAPPVQQTAPAPTAPAPVTPPRTDAAHLNNPAPQYPALSRRLGEQGRVMLDVYILPDGSVGEIKLNKSSGFPRLDNAALQAVKTWKYVPAKRGDKPIPFWYVQPVSFVLNN